MSVYETEQQFIDLRSVLFSKIILDVGGGGEGVITRHSGSHAVEVSHSDQSFVLCVRKQ